MFSEQLNKVKTQQGFIAALDQSGGSTPKALKAYGVEPEEYSSDKEMFDMVHAMRTRIMTSKSFTGEKVLGAILFEDTLDREVEGKPTSLYLWEEKQVVPFLKVDKGLADEENGTQIMKPMPGLAELLEKAKAKNVFGTKMRSNINQANETGIKAVVSQQFDIAKQIIEAGLVPIVEPEVNIHCPEKAEAEKILKIEILSALNDLNDDQKVMLKLTLPTETNFYKELVDHPAVVKVVALSGGYSREDANKMLSENNGVIASFSRALTEGLSTNLSDTEFDELLGNSIEGIYTASCS